MIVINKFRVIAQEQSAQKKWESASQVTGLFQFPSVGQFFAEFSQKGEEGTF